MYNKDKVLKRRVFNMKIACQDTLIPGDNIKKILLNTKELGFDGIEISGEKFLQNPTEVNEAFDSTDIELAIICAGHRGWLLSEDKQKQREAVRDIKELLNYAAKYKAIGVLTPTIYGTSDYLPYPPRKRSLKEDEKLLIDTLNELGAQAVQRGVYLLLEPLIRYQTHYINKLSEGIEIIDKLDNNGVKLMADTFHMNMEEKDIDKSLKEAKDYLYHIHLSDSNRRLPGQGHIDFPRHLATLKSIGYNKYLSFEALKPDNPTKQLKESLKYILKNI